MFLHLKFFFTEEFQNEILTKIFHNDNFKSEKLVNYSILCQYKYRLKQMVSLLDRVTTAWYHISLCKLKLAYIDQKQYYEKPVVLYHA